MAAKEHLPSWGAIYISYSSTPSSDGEIQHAAGRARGTCGDCQATVLTSSVTNSCRDPSVQVQINMVVLIRPDLWQLRYWLRVQRKGEMHFISVWVLCAWMMSRSIMVSNKHALGLSESIYRMCGERKEKKEIHEALFTGLMVTLFFLFCSDH